MNEKPANEATTKIIRRQRIAEADLDPTDTVYLEAISHPDGRYQVLEVRKATAADINRCR